MLIGRLLRFVFRRPGATLAALAATGLWGGVAVNALVLQDRPHPAPLLGGAGIEAPVRNAGVERVSAVEDAERRRVEEERRALVRELQTLLAERGFYAGDIDGLHGPMTADAIGAFEAAAGLDVTGEPRAVLLAHIELSDFAAPRPAAAEATAAAPAPTDEELQAASPVEATVGSPAAHDFAETGLPGMATLTEADAAIEGPSEPEQTAAVPAGDPRVAAVQRVLADLGYAPGRIDGQLGPQTEDAIRRFQHDRGLEPTGGLDETLLRELSAVSGESLG